MKITELLDRLETVKEVLRERETVVTPELLEAIDYAMGLLAQMLSAEKLIQSPMNDLFSSLISDLSDMNDAMGGHGGRRWKGKRR
jgi:hypothetical protein|tara:strand:- start:260 stop:514 length:255 start_codon:yes stop_codon:yes gene_type:complete